MAGKSKARCVCAHPAQLITLFKLTSIRTARSSSASSQPHKQASSIPRSVFGRVPSWPPSSMIHEVRMLPRWMFFVFCSRLPRRVALRLVFNLSFTSFPPSPCFPARAAACHSIILPFFHWGGRRAEGMCAWVRGARVPSLVSLPTPNACVVRINVLSTQY
jgi:hypothetical protein